jgi:N-acyl-D-aspartate/D-glutamate deacylase
VLNCFNATRLLSESRERALGRRERFRLKMHTMMCAGCRNFGDQVVELGTISNHYVKRESPEEGGSTDASGDQTK